MTAKLVLLSALALGTSAAAVPEKAIRESWGKPGVSLDQYRADALSCGRQGYYLDIANTQEAKAFVTASKQLNSMSDANSFIVPPGAGQDPMGPAIGFAAQQQHVIDTIQPDQKMRALGKTMQSAVDQCLSVRGYQKFRLTAGQTKRLGKLKIGSDERRQYLYSLASDPEVLSAQAEAPSPAATTSR